ncbi:hypothetical protein LTS18_002494, partial [Coniosporium uncinatum]
MEKELSIPTCLFGGPPVRDDNIKLAESQIGFMNIFARPLFEAVTDILPAMRFSVQELSANKAMWEGKIEVAKLEKARSSQLLLPGTFPSNDLVPQSPRSSGDRLQLGAGESGDLRTSRPSHLNKLDTIQSIRSPTHICAPDHDRSDRRSSGGSLIPKTNDSRRSSLGLVVDEKGVRRSSTPSIRYMSASENIPQAAGSRRGSGDASITAILVTSTPGTPSDKKKKQQHSIAEKEANYGSRLRSLSPTKRKQRSPEKDSKSGRSSIREKLKSSSGLDLPNTSASEARQSRWGSA